MPTRRPPPGRVQILKSPADIRVIRQPSDSMVSAARLFSRMMSKGCVCRLRYDTSASQS